MSFLQRSILIVAIAFHSINFSYAKEKIAFWDQQRKGTNIFNASLDKEIWQAAAEKHIEIVRLAPDKWHSKAKDFLLGDADDYKGLIYDDLKQLKETLAEANEHHIKIILTMLSLPGARWKQLNLNQDDSRLWQDKKYQEQAIHFWQDLARALRKNAAIVAYNIINEPHPETIFEFRNFTVNAAKNFEKKSKGMLCDLTLFYQRIVNAIRIIDPDTPIILDVGLYADPRTFEYFKPIKGKSILYAFHMYEPYDYTNKNQNNGKYIYPGNMILDNHITFVNKETLQLLYFAPVIRWQKQYHIPSNRIFVEEFGGHRTTKGIDYYFEDLIETFDKNNWHWAFYSFREDTWDGMDYELGDQSLGADYWERIAKGEQPELPRSPNHIWNMLEKHL